MTRISLKQSTTLNKRPDPASLLNGEVALNINPSSPGLFFKDSDGGLVKAGPTAFGSTAPNATPASGGFAGNTTGELWYDNSSGAGVLKIYNGTTWVPTYVASNLVGLTNGSTSTLGVGANTSGSPNVYVGVNAGAGNTSQGNSVMIGYNAKSGGASAVVIGYQAGLNASNTATGNLLVGYEAGKDALGGENTVMGYQAGQKAKGITAFGYQALQNATGTPNTAVGYRALASLTTGTGNNAVGHQALMNITGGSNNCALGEGAGSGYTGAVQNTTSIGFNAGMTGSDGGNICIGAETGSGTSGGGNILIGNGIKNAGTLTDCTIIGKPNFSISNLSGEVILCDNTGNARLRFNSSGAVQFSGSGYGNAGDFLQSQGGNAPPKWVSGANGDFLTEDGLRVTVQNGIITSVF